MSKSIRNLFALGTAILVSGVGQIAAARTIPASCGRAAIGAPTCFLWNSAGGNTNGLQALSGCTNTDWDIGLSLDTGNNAKTVFVRGFQTANSQVLCTAFAYDGFGNRTAMVSGNLNAFAPNTPGAFMQLNLGTVQAGGHALVRCTLGNTQARITNVDWNP